MNVVGDRCERFDASQPCEAMIGAGVPREEAP